MKVLFRIIASPFVLGVIIIAHIRFVLIRFKDFIWYGGEQITYNKAISNKTIQDVFELIKNNEQ
jgi:hypothetical protein